MKAEKPTKPKDMTDAEFLVEVRAAAKALRKLKVGTILAEAAKRLKANAA